MAEGLQRRIEYSDLKFISSFAMEKILDFQTWEEPGEHARGNFRLLLSENETGINSMNAPISAITDGISRQMLHHPQAHAAVVVRTLPLFHNRLVRRDA